MENVVKVTSQSSSASTMDPMDLIRQAGTLEQALSELATMFPAGMEGSCPALAGFVHAEFERFQVDLISYIQPQLSL